ncbi:TIM barrel protein [uncultured Draconibacterium sp.]|uniref:hydroxypyruvate isomerase family protein n=1 Tax=uncultured Draconibacterium sp. TaxID=1573823 RepID=UPI0025DC83A7|nr:TIM barrel protein [uncultured Draconibacterium sp.]
MKRRNFIKNTAASGIALTGLTGALQASGGEKKKSNKAKFNLKYAPSLGTFNEHAGEDPIDNIKFMADQGFRAVFDNSLMKKEPALQEKIANELARNNMDLGPFVLYADFKTKSFVTQNEDIKQMLKDTMHKGLEVQKRTGVKTALIVPGRFDEGLEHGYQMANIIDNLRMCCDIVGPTGLELVMEPLNAWTNHPGLILTKMPEAYMLCVAVNHPSCKIVNDMYHQQITEGNIIPNIDKCWDHIGAFHIGDNPGRKEPGTGEINYLNIFKHIYDKGYNGVLCCEHGKSISGKKGEKAFIEAYRTVDNF